MVYYKIIIHEVLGICLLHFFSLLLWNRIVKKFYTWIVFLDNGCGSLSIIYKKIKI